MSVFADRVQETSTVVGTGTLTLLGAVAGFQSFATAFAISTLPGVPYTIADTLGNWETGHGTFTLSGTTLTRVPVASSNSSALVNFPAGIKQVFNALLASDYNNQLLSSALLDSFFGSTRGAIIYRGAAGWTKLNPAAANYVLLDGGPGADPHWGPAPSGSSCPSYSNVLLQLTNVAYTPPVIGGGSVILKLLPCPYIPPLVI